MVPRVDRRVEVHSDLAAASAALAVHLRSRARASVRERGRFTWVLSGGGTPLGLFRRLARDRGGDWPWRATEVFFADERCVPPDHPDSNFGAAWETLLSRVPIPRHRVHRLRGELRSRSLAAARYARRIGPIGTVRTHDAPRFDLVLLGIGPDGHTASVFPRSPAARDERRSVVVVPRPGRPPFVPRLTLTPPALSSALEVCFLVAGADKAEAVARTLRAGPKGDTRYPASRVRPLGWSVWYLDRAAAAALPDGAS